MLVLFGSKERVELERFEYLSRQFKSAFIGRVFASLEEAASPPFFYIFFNIIIIIYIF